MFEQFGNYSDIRWHACAAAQFIGMGSKMQISPDLENFKLERFKDLRENHRANENRIYEIMLIDNRSKTNIFIDGPDELMDRMIERLLLYKDKSWREIQAMDLEKSMATCENVAMSLCDPRVKDMFEWIDNGQEDKAEECDARKARPICKECKNYKFNGEIE